MPGPSSDEARWRYPPEGGRQPGRSPVAADPADVGGAAQRHHRHARVAGPLHPGRGGLLALAPLVRTPPHGYAAATLSLLPAAWIVWRIRRRHRGELRSAPARTRRPTWSEIRVDAARLPLLLLVFAVQAGFFLGPVVGGALVARHGYHGYFTASTAMALAAAVVSMVLARQRRAPAPRREARPGAAGHPPGRS
ncbi:MAG TPA: hypothetical protein VFF02_08155 [Anaeromyxobacteraceae bacterium]|nr:hypothetical protein [Anaeromyxobacteraceae bacterium]